MTTAPPLGAPLFTGGTGRCGTTIVARMLDHHPLVGRTRPWEARFLTDRFGLCDLVAAREARLPVRLAREVWPGSTRAFEQRLRGPWFRRTPGNGKLVGLHQGIDEATLDGALVGFRERLRRDPRAAAARLTHDLLDPPVRAAGKSRWVESTPLNAIRVDALLGIFPDLRLLHMIRDGRDVAASIAARYWGPDDIDEALAFWEKRMALAGRAVAAAPPGRVLTVQLEDLVLRDRARTLHRMLDFLGLEPAREVLAFHADRMAPENANLRRWEGAVEPGRRAAFADAYDCALRRLVEAGVPVPV